MRWKTAFAVVILSAVFAFPCISSAQDQKYETLMKLLIDLKGWEAQPANGMEVGDKAGTIIIVMRDYHSGSKLMHTQIAVGKTSKKAWAQFEQGETIDTPDLFSTIMTTPEYKVGISYEKKSDMGSIVVPLNVKAGNAIFSLAFVGMPYEDALGIAKGFSWKDMEQVIENK
jgi:hypothetical protein